MRIMRPRRGLRMILHAEQREIPMAQAFECLVVQVDMGQLNFAVGQRIWINGKIMVVRGDLDLPGLQLLYRMIAAMMSKFQLECFAAERNPRELMPKANPENWLSPHEPADRI